MTKVFTKISYVALLAMVSATDLNAASATGDISVGGEKKAVAVRNPDDLYAEIKNLLPAEEASRGDYTKREMLDRIGKEFRFMNSVNEGLEKNPLATVGISYSIGALKIINNLLGRLTLPVELSDAGTPKCTDDRYGLSATRKPLFLKLDELNILGRLRVHFSTVESTPATGGSAAS